MHHMVNDAAEAVMKPSATLLNTSRGGLVDTQSLLRGLVSGKTGSAGLHVYEEESGYFYEDRSNAVVADEVLGRLISLSDVAVTSHMAFLTREALANIADTTFDNIAEYGAG